MLVPDPVQFWHWWALGGVLSIIEVFASGFMFLRIGIAAGLVGCLLLVWPGLEVPGQIFAFALLSVASLIVWSRFQKVRPAKSDKPNLNRRGAQYVGQRGALLVPIVNGRGRIRLGDSSWSVTGPDLPAGVSVELPASRAGCCECARWSRRAPIRSRRRSRMRQTRRQPGVSPSRRPPSRRA